MGADGHINIIDREKALKEFPNADDLIRYLPCSYIHELDGKKYYHLYYGDNMCVAYFFDYDWYIGKDDPPELKEQLKKFVEWIDNKNNHTHWEVWT